MGNKEKDVRLMYFWKKVGINTMLRYELCCYF